MATITNNDIAQAIYLSAKGKTGTELDTVLAQSVKLLADKRLLSKSGAILSKVQSLIDIDTGITRATVSSPRKLEKSSISEITEALKKRYGSKEVVFNELLAPDLIGGIKIEVGDEVIDASLKGKVKKLQDHLINN